MPAISVQVREACFQTPLGTTLIQPLSFSLGAGQRLAIVGPNGAGKSTLLRMLAGLLAPTSGSILLNDEPLHSMDSLARARRIAVLGQADHADVRLRVQDYVALGCLPHRQKLSLAQRQAAVADALTLCKLSNLARRAMGTLSGGERQRAHLARTLAQQPRLLLLDEPTNHLDPRATLDLLYVVRELGITVIAVLHDLSLVPPWADRVAILKGGALVRYDSPIEALNPVTVHQVFSMRSYYVPHPHGAQPMLVLDVHHPELPQPAHGRALSHFSFFNNDEEPSS